MRFKEWTGRWSRLLLWEGHYFILQAFPSWSSAKIRGTKKSDNALATQKRYQVHDKRVNLQHREGSICNTLSCQRVCKYFGSRPIDVSRFLVVADHILGHERRQGSCPEKPYCKLWILVQNYGSRAIGARGCWCKNFSFHNFVSLFRSRLTRFLTFLLLDSDGLMPFRGGDAQMYSSSPYENVAS